MKGAFTGLADEFRACFGFGVDDLMTDLIKGVDVVRFKSVLFDDLEFTENLMRCEDDFYIRIKKELVCFVGNPVIRS